MVPNSVENLVYLCIPSVFITSRSQTQMDMQGLIACSVTARAGTYTAGNKALRVRVWLRDRETNDILE